MAVGNTYTAIATQTLGSTSSLVTFSSIASTYTDLVLVMNGKLSTTSAHIRIRFNGDTGSNYSNTYIDGDGTTAQSTRLSNQTSGQLDWDAYWDATAFDGMILTQIMNYSNSTTYKSYLARAGRAARSTDATVGLWRSTSAITSVSVFPTADTFAAGSTFTLYGITAA